MKLAIPAGLGEISSLYPNKMSHPPVPGPLKLKPSIKSDIRRQIKSLSKAANPESLLSSPPLSLEPYDIEQDIHPGTGRIFVSGTTVHGTGTCFMQELKQSGSVIVKIGETVEKRKVVLVLSDKSACINEPLMQEYSGEFQCQDPPIRVDPRKEMEEQVEKRRKMTETTHAYDIRVKRGPWTYKTTNVVTDKDLTREDLLDIRARKVRDKHCWM
jgi:hypothetical protein